MKKKIEEKSVDRVCLLETTKKMVSFKKTLLDNLLKCRIQTPEKPMKLVLAQINNQPSDQRRKKAHQKTTGTVDTTMNKSTSNNMKTMKRS